MIRKRVGQATVLAFGVLVGALTAQSAQWTPAGMVKHANLEYAAPGGKPLLLDLFVPREATSNVPVILWIPGDDWTSAAKSPCPILRLGKDGYAIASLNYRTAADAPFPAALQDCKAAVRWLRANADKYGLDYRKIGVYGADAGGHLAALMATTSGVRELEGEANPGHSSSVQAACVFHAPTDLSLLLEQMDPGPRAAHPLSRWLNGPVSGSSSLADLANPIRHASRDDAPMLLVHGRQDKVIPEQHSILLYAAMTRAGSRATLRLVDRGHGVQPDRLLKSEIQTFFYGQLRR